VQAESDLMEFLDESCDDIECIIDYGRRPFVGEIMEQKAVHLKTSSYPRARFQLHTSYILKWFAPTFLCLYIAFAAPKVVNGSMSLGAFLATMAIIKNLGQDIEDGFTDYQVVTASYLPLKRLWRYLNKPLELTQRRKQDNDRLEAAQAMMKEIRNLQKIKDKQAAGNASSHTRYVTDLLPINLTGVMFKSFDDGLVLQNINVSVPQGTAVAVLGHHHSGRGTLLRILANKVDPGAGEVFVPTHLRILHVSMEPVMLTLSAYRDLTFGIRDRKDVNPRRVEAILKRLGFQKMLDLCKDEMAQDLVWLEGKADGAAEEVRVESTDTSWQKQLTGTEQSLLHIARALVMNPEVLVMQRPFHRFNGNIFTRVRSALIDHVHARGLFLPDEEKELRRPRTMLYSVDTQAELEGSDICWKMQQSGTQSTPCEIVDVTDHGARDAKRRPSLAARQLGNNSKNPAQGGPGKKEESDKRWCTF